MGRNMREDLERLGEGKEYDQNVSHETLKEHRKALLKRILTEIQKIANTAHNKNPQCKASRQRLGVIIRSRMIVRRKPTS